MQRMSGIMGLTVLLWSLPQRSAAQLPISLHVDSALYGDDTEFSTPFRTGETILGSFQRIFLKIEPSDRATFELGLYANERAGSPSPIDRGLPIVTLRLGTAREQLIFGTLDSPDHRQAFGPDRTTPHGLLPPLAVETLWFTRAYEAGVQWLAREERVRHDIWFDYQQENTPDHREKLDAGAVGRIALAGPFSGGYQFHIVHHGGQQYASGPVAESIGYSLGVVAERVLTGVGLASAEVYGLRAYDRPDGAVPARTVTGRAVFVRAAAELRGWRGHLIVWRGDDFNHGDGDPNYLSRLRSGARYGSTRDYAELGVSRLFKPAAAVDFEGSVRLHRIEAYCSYSYRLLSTIHLKVWQTQ